MAESILVLNAGSSSIKFAVFPATRPNGGGRDTPVFRGAIEGIARNSRFRVADANGDTLFNDDAPQAANHDEAIGLLFGWLDNNPDAPDLVAAGHRVVHGSDVFSEPVLVTPEIMERLDGFSFLAPHHQPHNVAAIRAVQERLGIPQVACFDTAFHAAQPALARQTGLPARYWEDGVRRYGFHGLAFESVMDSWRGTTGREIPKRLVLAHLGNGASMCAVLDGRSIAATMGFSTVDGLPMGTRSGAVDPGALLHVARAEGLDIEGLSALIYEQSGLLGLSGIDADMRTLLDSPEPTARTAIDFFCYRICRELGSLAAALGGLDALVFSGGIGENAASVRQTVMEGATWLGLEPDADANRAGGSMISTAACRVSAWVIPSDEERIIAGHTRGLTAGGGEAI
ncbi:MAG: acetate/propionate family kinase [Alphaproteobacteria bacterium]|nr:acetate/propionate family kinase [Alphaproteobacteria bacterium]